MSSDFKFSAAMCVYNGDNPEFFDEALESVFNQTLRADEVILSVDGPISDELEAVVRKYEELYKEFRVFRLDENKGHGIARNFALSNCSYKYVAIADADDINIETRFEKQIECFKKNPDLAAVSSGCYHFNDSIKNILNEETLPVDDAEIKKYMKTRCPLCQASVMLNIDFVNKAGGYSDWYHAEDYYLWIRMFLNGAVFANIKESLIYVRTTPEQADRRGGKKYFLSLRKLYRFMLKNKVISLPYYIFNVSSRFVIQIVLGNKARTLIRRLFQ